VLVVSAVPGSAQDAPAPLPGEILSLIQYAELHSSGWWDKALDRLTVLAAWNQAPCTRSDLYNILNVTLGAHISQERVDAVVVRCLTARILIELSDGKLKPSETTSQSLTGSQNAIRNLLHKMQERLRRLVEARSIQWTEAMWDDFQALFVQPLIAQSGARIYEVVAAGVEIESIPSYQEIVKPICDRYGPQFQNVLIDFLDPSDQDVRSYVLGQLNTQYVREAAGLDPAILEKISSNQPIRTTIRVFLDTNVLFSVLGLHSNPSNEVAANLMGLVVAARASVPIKLYVLPITVDETRRVLRDAIVRYADIRPIHNFALVANDMHEDGILASYMQAATGRGIAGAQLSSQAYFGPYEEHLITILRDKGIELYNDDLEELRMDQAVIDDIHRQNDSQQARKRGPKPYAANLHDMVLWHFAHRSRPARAENPAEQGTWICTVDYGLVAFDRFKTKRLNGAPTCLTPASLTQLLQFWVPRSDSLDIALVGSLRESVLFLTFDGSTEKTTIRILRTLSRFEGAEEFAKATIFHIATNEALRARMEQADDDETEDTSLVESALAEEVREMQSTLEKLEHEKAEKEGQAQEAIQQREASSSLLHAAVKGKEAEIERLSSTIDSLQETLESEREASNSRIDQLAADQETLKSDVARQKQEAADANTRTVDRRRLLKLIALIAIIGLVLTGTAEYVAVLLFSKGALYLATISAGVAVFLLVLLGLDTAYGHSGTQKGTPFHLWIRSVRKKLLAALGGILLAIVGSAIWQILGP
jgi:hypothetical protein